MICDQSSAGVGDGLNLGQLQSELVGLQSSLFSLGLELEASQRSLKQSQRQGDDLLRFKDRLNSDLQEALQHREATEKHNQVGLLVKDRLSQKHEATSVICLCCRICAMPFKKPAVSCKLKKQR